MGVPKITPSKKGRRSLDGRGLRGGGKTEAMKKPDGTLPEILGRKRRPPLKDITDRQKQPDYLTNFGGVVRGKRRATTRRKDDHL